MWPHSTDPISTQVLLLTTLETSASTSYFLAGGSAPAGGGAPCPPLSPFQQMYGRNRPLLVLLKQNPCHLPRFSVPLGLEARTSGSNLPSFISPCMAKYDISLNSPSRSRVSNHVALSPRFSLSSESISLSSDGKLFALVPTQRATRKAKTANNTLLSITAIRSVTARREPTTGKSEKWRVAVCVSWLLCPEYVGWST